MRLIHEPTGSEIKVGDRVETFRGEEVKVESFNEGRVYCLDKDGRINEWFHSVIRATVVD